MKALIWTIRVVLALVMAGLIAASGMLLYSFQVQKADPPVLLGYAPFTVANGEMTPSLYPGDLAILRMGPECVPGDIVAFRKEGELVLRRVVGTSEEMYITQQEAFGQPDVDLLDPAQVEAVCVTYLPGCGTVAEFLYSPVGLAILVVLALAVLVVPVFLSGGSVKPEGPQVDYGAAPPRPQPRPQQPRPVQRRPAATQSDWWDEEEDFGAPSKPQPRPQTPKPQPVRPRQEPVAPPPPAPTRRSGGSHYKPRH